MCYIVAMHWWNGSILLVSTSMALSPALGAEAAGAPASASPAEAAPAEATPAVEAAPVKLAEAPAVKEEKRKLAPPKVSGYIQPLFAYMTEPAEGDLPPKASNFTALDSTTNFLLKRARLRLTGEIYSPKLTYTLLLDGLASATNKVVRDGYVSYTPIKQLELRAGQFRVPFGWENWTSFTVLPFIERAIVSDTLTRGLDTRDLGVAALGAVPVTEAIAVEYRVAVVNGAGGGVVDPLPRKDPYGRIGVAYEKMVKLGVSAGKREALLAAVAPALPVREKSTLLGVDLQVDYGPVFVAAEYVQGDHQEPEDLLRSGFYVLALGRLPLDLELAARYEEYSPDDEADELKRQRVTGGLNYKLEGDNAKLQVNYRHDMGDDDAWRQTALLIQTTFAF